MVRVFSFMAELTSTSIPLEIAAKTDEAEAIDVTAVSFYDSEDESLDPDVANLNVEFLKLGADSRFDVDAYLRLVTAAREQDIDVLHTHHNSTGSFARLFFALEGTPIVNTEHNDHRFFSTLQKVTNAVTLPLVDVLVSNSRSTEESLAWYERMLSKPAENEVVYNGIDVSRIECTKNVAASVELPPKPRIVTVGRLVKQKNYSGLLRAFRRVLEQTPDANLIIVGDGPLRNNLKLMARELGISDSVHFAGYLPTREDVYSVLHDSDIAVFPSNYEGFCVAAVEAMGCGLPVVASDIKVLHEVIGNAGEFVSPNDPDELAQEIVAFLDDEDKCEEFGNRAFERSRSTFPIERTATKYAQIYRSLSQTESRP